MKSSGTTVENRWNVVDYVAFQDFNIIAHRGAGVRALENSMEAMDYSWNLGCKPEVDLRMTSDKVIFCLHDINHKDPASKSIDLSKLTWEEVCKLSLAKSKEGSFDKRPLYKLEEIFDKMNQSPNRYLYMDIKNADFDVLAGLVTKYRFEKRTVLTTSKHEEVCEWIKRVPNGETLIWIGGSEENKEQTLHKLRKKNFDCITQLQIHVNPNSAGGKEPILTPSSFVTRTGSELRDYGIEFQVFPWASNDESIFRYLLDLGVAAFSTDYPDSTINYVKQYYKDHDGL